MSLHDFGADALSFGYQKALTVNYLKIDGQFIRDLVADPLDRAAVRCLHDVARVIGVKTIVEFVEHQAALDVLHEIGVDYAQGYLIHRPEPLDDLVASLAPARLGLRASDSFSSARSLLSQVELGVESRSAG